MSLLKIDNFAINSVVLINITDDIHLAMNTPHDLLW